MRPWRSSFVTQWAALFASLLIAVVLISGWLRDRASREYFLQDQRRNLAHRLEVMRVRLQTAIDGVRKDILYLSSAPAFARLAAARDEAEREAARREAGLHVRGGLQVRPTYFRARLIGLADGGREILRFDQEGGMIRETLNEELQKAGDQVYFLETVKLPAGKFYLSEIKLNRESGRVSEPHRPTLRAATPVFDQTGKLFGIVIVHVDVTTFFGELRELAGPDAVVTLSNPQGDYLLHPEPANCFGFDLGRRYTLFDDHPELRQGDRHGRFADERSELSITDEFPFTWESDKSLILRLAVAKGPLLAPLQARRAQNFAVTIALAAVAGVVVILVTNFFARSLRRMAEAVGRYEPGKPLPELPVERPDEVGLLARKFRDMASNISEQMGSLREERQRAESAVRAREEFLATISHEIRTPMNAVLGMAHLLENEGHGPLQAERLRTLKFAGRHLMALLNNLLDRDRIESGDIVFDRLDFDLRDLLENLHLSLEPLARRKGLGFVLEAGACLPRCVHGDPVRLYQVLNNLAHNAIKFTQRGEVVVRAAPGQAEEVRFEISDTGPGLSDPVLDMISNGLSENPWGKSTPVPPHPGPLPHGENAPKPFPRWTPEGGRRSADFQSAVSPISNRQPDDLAENLKQSQDPQAGSTATQQIGNLRYGTRGKGEEVSAHSPSAAKPTGLAKDLGTRASSGATAGLGLRISQRLIELLGGHLVAESTPDGTKLSFVLGLPAAADATTSRAQEAPPDLTGYSALIVEDEPSNQLVLSALLVKTGLAVDSAVTAEQARAKLPTNSYDFVFLDMQLPDAHGAELAATLLRMQPGLRVVAVTAQVSAEIRAACEAAGVRAFISKPIEPAELYTKLRRLTEPKVESVAEVFDHDAAKVSEYITQLDREFQNVEAELRALAERPDPERLRRLHHRMRNACGQLSLWKLDKTLGELREAMEREAPESVRELSARALRLVASVRQLTGGNRASNSSR